MKNKKQKWDNTYEGAEFKTATAASVLIENTHLLPSNKKKYIDALDLACGRAGNAQLLSNAGFFVDAIDISSVLIESLKSYVSKEKLNINCILRDIESTGIDGDDIEENQSDKQYDIIVVSYFLNRELFPQIKAALKHNGLLFYQTWSQLRTDETGPNNPKFRLSSGELLELCSGLKPIMYREDGLEGDLTKGFRNEAMIVAQKV